MPPTINDAGGRLPVSGEHHKREGLADAARCELDLTLFSSMGFSRQGTESCWPSTPTSMTFIAI